MSDLKPCPFCGSEKICISIIDGSKAEIFCEECKGRTGTLIIPQKDEYEGVVIIKLKYMEQLIEAWNRRDGET